MSGTTGSPRGEGRTRSTWQLPVAGARVRAGRWSPVTGAATAHVVLLQGRGDFLEKHDDLAALLTGSGAEVVSLDWRGQGGSSRLGADPGLADVDDVRRHLDDLDAVLAGTVERDGPLRGRRLVVAHSMGSLVGVLHLAEHPADTDAAVLLSPMFRFPAPLAPAPVALAAAVAGAVGAGRRPAPGERVGTPGSGVGMATGDPAGRADLLHLEQAHPDKVVGGSTWRWAGAMARAMRALERAPLDRVRTDVLVALGGGDRTVDTRAGHVVAARLPRARVVTYPHAGHDLLRSGASAVHVRRDLLAHLRLPVAVGA